MSALTPRQIPGLTPENAARIRDLLLWQSRMPATVKGRALDAIDEAVLEAIEGLLPAGNDAFVLGIRDGGILWEDEQSDEWLHTFD